MGEGGSLVSLQIQIGLSLKTMLINCSLDPQGIGQEIICLKCNKGDLDHKALFFRRTF